MAKDDEEQEDKQVEMCRVALPGWAGTSSRSTGTMIGHNDGHREEHNVGHNVGHTDAHNFTGLTGRFSVFAVQKHRCLRRPQKREVLRHL